MLFVWHQAEPSFLTHYQGPEPLIDWHITALVVPGLWYAVLPQKTWRFCNRMLQAESIYAIPDDPSKSSLENILTKPLTEANNEKINITLQT